MIDVVAVTEPRFVLAEGPVWDATRRLVLWVDIPEGLVLVGRIDGDSLTIDTEHHVDGFAGAVATSVDGSLLVAETHALTVIGPDGARHTEPVSQVGPDDRLNDGTCDAAGRFLVGTLSLTGDHDGQRLLQVDAGASTVLDDDLGLANGLAFSPDDSILYSVDSVPGRVWARPYDQATGATGTRTLLIDLPDATPDGLAVDEHGRLWIAIWSHGEVRCYSPDGALVDTIVVPALHTSSVAFVGDDLDLLLITSARTELTPDQLAEHPLSGSLFLARPGCRGTPVHPWSGHLSPAA